MELTGRLKSKFIQNKINLVGDNTNKNGTKHY